ncbi:MAG: type II toxin-antitoxin system RelE/ParE family toxin [Parvularculaceae bacterium]
MSGFRLSNRAKTRLEGIFAYTDERFGCEQAEHYRDSLILRLRALAEGKVSSGRPCSALVRGAAVPDDLRYIKSGAHFIVYLEQDNTVHVVDFIHEMRDLPARLHELAKGKVEN